MERPFPSLKNGAGRFESRSFGIREARGTLKVWLVDLSTSGARITLDTRLERGSRCTLELPPELGSLTLSSRVV
jgi:hypothetical protein